MVLIQDEINEKDVANSDDVRVVTKHIEENTFFMRASILGPRTSSGSFNLLFILYRSSLDHNRIDRAIPRKSRSTNVEKLHRTINTSKRTRTKLFLKKPAFV